MRLQGAISPRVEARLDELLGHPETCPHGNPIDAETAQRRPAGTRLSDMEAGSNATVYRITEEAEEDAGLLSYLEARALTPGAHDHDPRPERIARLADARRSARAGDPRPASRIARARPARGGGSGAVPPRPGRGDDGTSRPDRPEPDRSTPHRDRADRAVQLPVSRGTSAARSSSPRGHRPGAQLDRLREGHPRRPALARPALGRGPGGRRRGRPRPVRPVPPDAPAAARTQEAAARLLAADQAYPCYCTAEELDADRKAQEAAKEPPRYVGRCAALTPDERAAREAEGRTGGDPLPGRDRRRRLRRHRPRPCRDRRLEPRRRLRHRPRRRHAALPLHRRRRRRGDGDQPRHPRRGPPVEHAEAHPAVPRTRLCGARLRTPAAHPQSRTGRR